jgi:hypothetical protein
VGFDHLVVFPGDGRAGEGGDADVGRGEYGQRRDDRFGERDVGFVGTVWNNAGANVAWTQTNATTATNAAVFAGPDGRVHDQRRRLDRGPVVDVQRVGLRAVGDVAAADSLCPAVRRSACWRAN